MYYHHKKQIYLKSQHELVKQIYLKGVQGVIVLTLHLSHRDPMTLGRQLQTPVELSHRKLEFDPSASHPQSNHQINNYIFCRNIILNYSIRLIIEYSG